ncbi:tyrosine-type recombinase/integrase [Hippea jasoniae]|uniref:tyrosine-type recombinase/integrase n=1 Tax=Hippea jasoniae TaxID=944479 RepID=UPI000552D710|nr:tyrosine-type recombinase/integrase [Hippea jasoniae]
MAIDKLVDEFIFHLKLKGLSKNTIASYMADLKEFAVFFSDMDFNKVNISGFVDELFLKDYKPATINRKLSSIRSFLKFLLKEGKIDFEVELKNIRHNRKPPYYIPFEVIASVCDSKRDGLIIELMYACGLRISEVVSLRVKDIIFDAGFIKVKGKGGKERFVPVALKTLEKLKSYILNERSRYKGALETDFLFISNRGRPFSRQGIWKIVKRKFRQKGYDIHPHQLRHMFATHLIENGANLRAVQEMLGHSSITTTQIYTQITDKAMEDAFRKFKVLE